MTRSVFALLSLVLATATLLPAQDPKSSAGSPRTTAGKQAPVANALRVGVVDFAKVLESYQGAIEGRKKISELKDQFQQQLDTMQKRAEDAKLLRDNYQRGSRDWYEKDLSVKLALQSLEGQQQIFEGELHRKREEFLVAMLEDMQQAVAIVAKEKKIALVLRVHEDLIDGSAATKARIFETRIVWFASEEIDITPDVSKLLRVPLPPRQAPKNAAAGSAAKPGK